MQIRCMAHLDPPANPPNRILLMDRLRQALSISQRNQTRTAPMLPEMLAIGDRCLCGKKNNQCDQC